MSFVGGNLALVACLCISWVNVIIAQDVSRGLERAFHFVPGEEYHYEFKSDTTQPGGRSFGSLNACITMRCTCDSGDYQSFDFLMSNVTMSTLSADVTSSWETSRALQRHPVTVVLAYTGEILSLSFDEQEPVDIRTLKKTVLALFQTCDLSSTSAELAIPRVESDGASWFDASYSVRNRQPSGLVIEKKKDRIESRTSTQNSKSSGSNVTRSGAVTIYLNEQGMVDEVVSEEIIRIVGTLGDLDTSSLHPSSSSNQGGKVRADTPRVFRRPHKKVPPVVLRAWAHLQLRWVEASVIPDNFRKVRCIQEGHDTPWSSSLEDAFQQLQPEEQQGEDEGVVLGRPRGRHEAPLERERGHHAHSALARSMAASLYEKRNASREAKLAADPLLRARHNELGGLVHLNRSHQVALFGEEEEFSLLQVTESPHVVLRDVLSKTSMVHEFMGNLHGYNHNLKTLVKSLRLLQRHADRLGKLANGSKKKAIAKSKVEALPTIIIDSILGFDFGKNLLQPLGDTILDMKQLMGQAVGGAVLQVPAKFKLSVYEDLSPIMQSLTLIYSKVEALQTAVSAIFLLAPELPCNNNEVDKKDTTFDPSSGNFEEALANSEKSKGTISKACRKQRKTSIQGWAKSLAAEAIKEVEADAEFKALKNAAGLAEEVANKLSRSIGKLERESMDKAKGLVPHFMELQTKWVNKMGIQMFHKRWSKGFGKPSFLRLEAGVEGLANVGKGMGAAKLAFFIDATAFSTSGRVIEFGISPELMKGDGDIPEGFNENTLFGYLKAFGVTLRSFGKTRGIAGIIGGAAQAMGVKGSELLLTSTSIAEQAAQLVAPLIARNMLHDKQQGGKAVLASFLQHHDPKQIPPRTATPAEKADFNGSPLGGAGDPVPPPSEVKSFMDVLQVVVAVLDNLPGAKSQLGDLRKGLVYMHEATHRFMNVGHDSSPLRPPRDVQAMQAIPLAVEEEGGRQVLDKLVGLAPLAPADSEPVQGDLAKEAARPPAGVDGKQLQAEAAKEEAAEKAEAAEAAAKAEEEKEATAKLRRAQMKEELQAAQKHLEKVSASFEKRSAFSRGQQVDAGDAMSATTTISQLQERLNLMKIMKDAGKKAAQAIRKPAKEGSPPAAAAGDAPSSKGGQVLLQVAEEVDAEVMVMEEMPQYEDTHPWLFMDDDLSFLETHNPVAPELLLASLVGYIEKQTDPKAKASAEALKQVVGDMVALFAPLQHIFHKLHDPKQLVAYVREVEYGIRQKSMMGGIMSVLKGGADMLAASQFSRTFVDINSKVQGKVGKSKVEPLKKRPSAWGDAAAAAQTLKGSLGKLKGTVSAELAPKVQQAADVSGSGFTEDNAKALDKLLHCTVGASLSISQAFQEESLKSELGGEHLCGDKKSFIMEFLKKAIPSAQFPECAAFLAQDSVPLVAGPTTVPVKTAVATLGAVLGFYNQLPQLFSTQCYLANNIQPKVDEYHKLIAQGREDLQWRVQEQADEVRQMTTPYIDQTEAALLLLDVAEVRAGNLLMTGLKGFRAMAKMVRALTSNKWARQFTAAGIWLANGREGSSVIADCPNQLKCVDGEEDKWRYKFFYSTEAPLFSAIIIFPVFGIPMYVSINAAISPFFSSQTQICNSQFGATPMGTYHTVGLVVDLEIYVMVKVGVGAPDAFNMAFGLELQPLHLGLVWQLDMSLEKQASSMRMGPYIGTLSGYADVELKVGTFQFYRTIYGWGGFKRQLNLMCYNSNSDKFDPCGPLAQPPAFAVPEGFVHPAAPLHRNHQQSDKEGKLTGALTTGHVCFSCDLIPGTGHLVKGCDHLRCGLQPKRMALLAGMPNPIKALDDLFGLHIGGCSLKESIQVLQVCQESYSRKDGASPFEYEALVGITWMGSKQEDSWYKVKLQQGGKTAGGEGNKPGWKVQFLQGFLPSAKESTVDLPDKADAASSTPKVDKLSMGGANYFVPDGAPSKVPKEVLQSYAKNHYKRLATDVHVDSPPYPNSVPHPRRATSNPMVFASSMVRQKKQLGYTVDKTKIDAFSQPVDFRLTQLFKKQRVQVECRWTECGFDDKSTGWCLEKNRYYLIKVTIADDSCWTLGLSFPEFKARYKEIAADSESAKFKAKQPGKAVPPWENLGLGECGVTFCTDEQKQKRIVGIHKAIRGLVLALSEDGKGKGLLSMKLQQMLQIGRHVSEDGTIAATGICSYCHGASDEECTSPPLYKDGKEHPLLAVVKGIAPEGKVQREKSRFYVVDVTLPRPLPASSYQVVDKNIQAWRELYMSVHEKLPQLKKTTKVSKVGAKPSIVADAAAPAPAAPDLTIGHLLEDSDFSAEYIPKPKELAYKLFKPCRVYCSTTDTQRRTVGLNALVKLLAATPAVAASREFQTFLGVPDQLEERKRMGTDGQRGDVEVRAVGTFPIYKGGNVAAAVVAVLPEYPALKLAGNKSGGEESIETFGMGLGVDTTYSKAKAFILGSNTRSEVGAGPREVDRMYVAEVTAKLPDGGRDVHFRISDKNMFDWKRLYEAVAKVPGVKLPPSKDYEVPLPGSMKKYKLFKPCGMWCSTVTLYQRFRGLNAMLKEWNSNEAIFTSEPFQTFFDIQETMKTLKDAATMPGGFVGGVSGGAGQRAPVSSTPSASTSMGIIEYLSLGSEKNVVAATGQCFACLMVGSGKDRRLSCPRLGLRRRHVFSMSKEGKVGTGQWAEHGAIAPAAAGQEPKLPYGKLKPLSPYVLDFGVHDCLKLAGTKSAKEVYGTVDSVGSLVDSGIASVLGSAEVEVMVCDERAYANQGYGGWIAIQAGSGVSYYSFRIPRAFSGAKAAQGSNFASQQCRIADQTHVMSVLPNRRDESIPELHVKSQQERGYKLMMRTECLPDPGLEEPEKLDDGFRSFISHTAAYEDFQLDYEDVVFSGRCFHCFEKGGKFNCATKKEDKMQRTLAMSLMDDDAKTSFFGTTGLNKIDQDVLSPIIAKAKGKLPGSVRPKWALCNERVYVDEKSGREMVYAGAACMREGLMQACFRYSLPYEFLEGSVGSNEEVKMGELAGKVQLSESLNPALAADELLLNMWSKDLTVKDFKGKDWWSIKKKCYSKPAGASG